MAAEELQQANVTANNVLFQRVIAAVLDAVVCLLLIAAVGQLPGLRHIYLAHIRRGEMISTGGFVDRGLLALTVMLVYWGGCELASGRTLGKALLRLRVVDEHGGPASSRQVIIRTGLRIVDVLPAGYLLGFLVILVTRRREQRLGDLLAHTRIVAER